MKASEIETGVLLAAEPVRTEKILAAFDEKPADDEDFERIGGTAVIPIVGLMSKSGWFGTSTVSARQAVQDAAQSDCDCILLYVDSPGGYTSGVDELAEAVRLAAQSKTVLAHINDTGASAAYWVASQASSISINRAGEAGSIGSYAVLMDTSKAWEAEGVTFHLIGTGGVKGAGAVPEVTEEFIREVQRSVDRIGGVFFDAVAAGRGLKGKKLKTVTDGRMFGADEALELGLVDSIKNWDEALAAAIKPRPANRRRAMRAELEQAAIR